MSIELETNIRKTKLNTLETIKLDISLKNSGNVSETLPGPHDLSDALKVKIFNESGILYKCLSGLTRQEMMSAGRIDTSYSLDLLTPGKTWQWTIDLCKYYFSIPAGIYKLQTSYDYLEKRISLSDQGHLIEISPVELKGVWWSRDNPIIDGLCLIFYAKTNDRYDYYIRQYNYGRPLAAWYNEKILYSDKPLEPFCATSNFFSSETFDHFFNKWVIWQQNENLNLIQLRWGKKHREYSFPMPKKRFLLKYAFYNLKNEIYLFMFAHLEERMAMECYKVKNGEMHFQFTYPLNKQLPKYLDIRADQQFIHICTINSMFSRNRGTHYLRLSLDGKENFHRLVYQTGLTPYSCILDLEEQRLRSIYWDGMHGHTLTLVVVPLSGEKSEVIEKILDIPTRGDIREIQFIQDKKGSFHILFSTSHSRLYYCLEDRKPQKLGDGEILFYPILLAHLDDIYFGFYKKGRGYRFLHSRKPHNYGPRIIAY